MRALALRLEAIAIHSSIEGKLYCAAAHLAACPEHTLRIAARFLAGTPLPPGAAATKVGRSTLIELVAQMTGQPEANVRRLATRRGDLGVAVGELFAEQKPRPPALCLDEIAVSLAALGQSSSRDRNTRLRDLLARATAMEAKYVIKLLLGSPRTGMQTSRVEEAIALAFNRDLDAVRRAHMLLGEIGGTAKLAAADKLAGVTLRAFRPVWSMLAQPTPSADSVIDSLEPPLIAEDKYDGIRAQLHFDGRRIRLYSRALEDTTHCFPELLDPPASLHGEWILDGEIVAWRDHRCLPFATLQQRLGRREVPMTLLLDAPVRFLAFDVLRSEGKDLIDSELRQRKQALATLPSSGPLRRCPWVSLANTTEIRQCYEGALQRGNEGAVFKDPQSLYRPGSRGRALLKLKRPPTTLDVVVTAAEYGRGKRAGMLSDLTFSVRGPAGLCELGKAYSGLTDEEIDEITRLLKRTTLQHQGSLILVEPTVALEVAFDTAARSNRHSSGFALRFPRIVRWRRDLDIEAISSVAEIERLYRQARR